MEFEDRLQEAIQRGKKRNEEEARRAAEKRLNEEELKTLHSKYRLQLSEHIESCLQRLTNYYPGFQLETVYGERGWGAACSRDDLRIVRGGRGSDYSRLEVTVRPYSDYHVLDLAAKGTIHNKEVFNRNYFDELEEADVNRFVELIDVWVLEYAELYAAKS